MHACQKRPHVGKLAKLGKRNSLQASNVEEAMTDADDEILTLDEVAVYLKAGKRTVYRLAKKGGIPAFKLGGTWRFRKADLERWIAGRTGAVAFDDERGGKDATSATSAPSKLPPKKKKSKG